MSAIIILSAPASAISALKAYRAFCEITLELPQKPDLLDRI
jgi:hypothetical protein